MKTSILKRPGSVLKLVAVIGGLLGLLFRFWLEMDAIDDKGLLIPGHPAHICLWILCLTVFPVLLLGSVRFQGATKKVPIPKRAPLAALGCVPAIMLLMLDIINNFQTVHAVFTLLSVMVLASLIVLALARLRGKTPPVLSHTAICVWMVVMLLQMYRDWSFDPQLHNYCFQLLAFVALSLATYQQAALDGGMGNFRKLWFWSLSAGFLCLTCLNAGVHYTAAAIWVLTNLPIPRVRKRPAR